MSNGGPYRVLVINPGGTSTKVALFEDERELFTAMLGKEAYAGEVGAFEGAMYQATGLYRSSADCIMFTRDKVGFCPVGSRASERVIDLDAK